MDLGDLLPKSADITRARVEGFVHSTLTKLAKDLGASPEILRQIRDNDGRYDVSTFSADFPGFPWKVAVDRVESYSVEDLFITPTKSPVFKAFQRHFPNWATERTLLFFKARGFTTLIMGTAERLKDCGVVLKGTVRDRSFYVTTYSEFVEVFGPLKSCSDE